MMNFNQGLIQVARKMGQIHGEDPGQLAPNARILFTVCERRKVYRDDPDRIKIEIQFDPHFVNRVVGHRRTCPEKSDSALFRIIEPAVRDLERDLNRQSNTLPL